MNHVQTMPPGTLQKEAKSWFFININDPLSDPVLENNFLPQNFYKKDIMPKKGQYAKKGNKAGTEIIWKGLFDDKFQVTHDDSSTLLEEEFIRI